MIVMGYPGIGKTSYAREARDRVIDLESSYFPDKESYVKLAIELDKQGYIVFVSTHAEVGELLKRATMNNNTPGLEVAVCYPVKYLKDQWIEKLRQRYIEDWISKNERAYKHCQEHYDEDIQYIEDQYYPRFKLIPITSLNYKFWVNDPWDFKEGKPKYELKVEMDRI